MSIMIEAIIGVASAILLGSLGWSFTISNRVAVLEADKVSLKELIDFQFASVNRRLDRIDAKLEK